MPFLAVDQEVLPDGVQDIIFRRKIDGLGVLDHVLDILRSDLAVGRDDGMHAAIVEPAHVAAAHPEINAADFDISHLLGFDDGVADVLAGQRHIDDFAFAHAARARLAHAHNVQRALRVHVADDRAHFRGADFQSNDDR